MSQRATAADANSALLDLLPSATLLSLLKDNAVDLYRSLVNLYGSAGSEEKAEDAILNPVESQMCNIAALICCNCPVQVSLQPYS